MPKKIRADEYMGPVVDNSDYYFQCVEDFLESCEGEDLPRYLIACKEVIGVEFDWARVCDTILDHTYGEFEIEGLDELRGFFEQWNAKQTQVWYKPIDLLVMLMETCPECNGECGFEDAVGPLCDTAESECDGFCGGCYADAPCERCNGTGVIEIGEK